MIASPYMISQEIFDQVDLCFKKHKDLPVFLKWWSWNVIGLLGFIFLSDIQILEIKNIHFLVAWIPLEIQTPVSLRMIKEVSQGIVYHRALRKTQRFKAICI